MAGEPRNRPLIGLDELEKALMQVDQSPRRPSGEDPLAELARLVGHDDPFKVVGGRSDFDDFLTGGARPAAPAPAGPIQPVYPPEMPAAPAVAMPVQPVDDPASIALAEMVEKAMADAHAANVSVTTRNLPADVTQLDPLELAGLGASGLSEAHPRPMHEDRMFEQMLAEMEARARQADSPPAGHAPVELVSFENHASSAAAIPPPPPRELASPGVEAAMAGLAAAAAARTAASPRPVAEPAPQLIDVDDVPVEPARPKGRRGVIMAGAVIGIAVIGVGALLALGRKPDQPRLPRGDAPVIAATPGVVKERPANPGGVEVPNQDKAIFQQRQEPGRTGERVAPREEQPVDLTQAQRPVRQIPGVPAVAQPAAPAAPVAPIQTASTETSPTATAPPVRQVQGIPIVLSPPTAPPPVAAPEPASVVPSITVSPPAARVETPAPVATQPPRVEPAQPRRVQSVPVRSEAGEQPRPRPVQPVRRAAEEPAASDPNAPLRITPPALRGTSTPQRVASAPPAATVSPETTQRIASDAGSGGGFSVQLAAEGSEDAAQARFTRMRGQFGDVLGSSSPSVRRAEVGGRSVYRLRVGNLSREEANSLCERLKAGGGSCFVARN